MHPHRLWRWGRVLQRTGLHGRLREIFIKKSLIASGAGIALVIGAVGLSTIKEHEGLRTKAYLDPVGIPTICYGHTGPEVRLGLTYTVEQCEKVLVADIAKHRRGLEQCIRVPLNQNQWDGVTSFAFNVGVSAACKSTMVRKINAGDFKGASAEFPKWQYASAGGRKIILKGLVKRRAAERALFDTPVSSPVPAGLAARYAYLTE